MLLRRLPFLQSALLCAFSVPCLGLLHYFCLLRMYACLHNTFTLHAALYTPRTSARWHAGSATCLHTCVLFVPVRLHFLPPSIPALIRAHTIACTAFCFLLPLSYLPHTTLLPSYLPLSPIGIASGGRRTEQNCLKRQKNYDIS